MLDFPTKNYWSWRRWGRWGRGPCPWRRASAAAGQDHADTGCYSRAEISAEIKRAKYSNRDSGYHSIPWARPTCPPGCPPTAGACSSAPWGPLYTRWPPGWCCAPSPPVAALQSSHYWSKCSRSSQCSSRWRPVPQSPGPRCPQASWLRSGRSSAQTSEPGKRNEFNICWELSAIHHLEWCQTWNVTVKTAWY